ncbi:MAG: NnrS family protein [Rhizobiales bacterium]|nr:NnrS family protein [Hyphomicrobiales bacterium]
MAIPAALSRRREYSGPALFSYGFRPFFLGAAVWSAAGILLWLPQYAGEVALLNAMSPLDWHIHEMLYGYVAAVVAGFLLTAIPNWTGRLPVTGTPLAALALLWIAGRAAIFFSANVGLLWSAVIDVSFLLVLAIVAGREIIAGRNWRNLRVLAILGLLILGNIVFHAEVWSRGAANFGSRLGLAAAIGLIMMIGGRVVPSFTRNWLARRSEGRLPVPFSHFDALSLAVSSLALIAWIARPDHVATGLLLLGACVLQTIRLARWAGERTLSERLVFVLHVAYAFIPLGFALAGASALWPDAVPMSAGIHAWTAGAIGLMTLAVMTRASLGHTGQPLTATPVTQAIYGFALIAALTRIIAAFLPSVALMHVAGVFWIAAFGCFAIVYGRLLIGRPPVWAARC